MSDCDIPKDNREELRRKLKSLVYAASETEYDELNNEIAGIANSQFLQYFTTNWETSKSCKSMWASYLRDQYLHLANTTNNRLESHHHKLKDLIGRTSSLSEMFDHVLTFSVTHALEYSQRSFSEEFTSRTTAFDNIPYVNEITSVCIEHAANLVCEQLEIAMKIDYQIKQEPHDDFTYELCYKNKTHFVNSSNSCSCTFSKTLGLPCRHLLAT